MCSFVEPNKLPVVCTGFQSNLWYMEVARVFENSLGVMQKERKLVIDCSNCCFLIYIYT